MPTMNLTQTMVMGLIQVVSRADPDFRDGAPPDLRRAQGDRLHSGPPGRHPHAGGHVGSRVALNRGMWAMGQSPMLSILRASLSSWRTS